MLALPKQGQSASPGPLLRRGVALSSWFSNAPRQPLTERDFSQIAEAGFDHVRLTVNPEYIGYTSASAAGPSPDPAAARWDGVDAAVAMATRNGLTVMFNIHPEEAYKNRLAAQAWLRDDFITFSRFAAKRYQDLPRDKFVFELLNEPRFYHNPRAYHGFIEKLVAAVRADMPDHVLLAGGPFTNDIDSLTGMAPFGDANMIYVFHFYDPFLFTHQGIGFGTAKTQLAACHDVPYPASKVDTNRDYAPTASDRVEASSELRQYVAEDWDAAHIRTKLQPVADWAASHGKRVVCSEFGANRGSTDAVSRDAWIADVRQTCEALGFGWTIWDYADLFGITTPVGAVNVDASDHAVTLVDPKHGHRKFDRGALAALGLKEASSDF